jgi:hypothetical protein
MYIEYYNNNIEYKDIDYKNELDLISKFPISGILGYQHYIKYIKKNYKSISASLGVFIDYPLSSSSSKHRLSLISEAIDIGCNFIVIPITFYSIINRKYDKFKLDIQSNIELCQQNNIEIRYMLEYRKFDSQLLTKVCKILVDNTIDVVYPSTGFFIDNIDDNLIASKFLIDKTNIKTIINANIWKTEQINHLIKNNIYGISINNTECLNLIDSKLYDNK